MSTVNVVINDQVIGTIQASDQGASKTRHAENVQGCLSGLDALLAAYPDPEASFNTRVDAIFESIQQTLHDPNLKNETLTLWSEYKNSGRELPPPPNNTPAIEPGALLPEEPEVPSKPVPV